MKTAKEMFRDLSYNLNKTSTHIEFSKIKNRNIFTIAFSKEKKYYIALNENIDTNIERPMIITMGVYKAITQHLLELGWIAADEEVYGGGE